MQEIAHIAQRFGLEAVFVVVLAEALGLPLPAMPLLIVAGALAAQGELSGTGALVVAIVACVIGNATWYLAGQHYGQRVLKTLCRISISPDSCVRQTEDFFGRWGVRTLLVARFIPGLSAIAPPMAGASRVAWGSFLAYAALGAGIWAGVSLAAGAFFADQILQLGDILARLGVFALYLLGGAFALFLAFKWWERRRFYRTLRMARISVQDLQALRHEGKTPVILDVRSEYARAVDRRRIPGARFVEMGSADGYLEGVSRDAEVVVYCDCPNEASAARVAQLLKHRGFRRVRPLAGGIDAWEKAGFELEQHDAIGLHD